MNAVNDTVRAYCQKLTATALNYSNSESMMQLSLGISGCHSVLIGYVV